MKLLDLLFNAASGGVVGVALEIGRGFFDVWRADREQKREIEKMEAMARIKIEGAAWDAFAKSQQPEALDNVWPWAASIRVLMRPALTLLLLGFLFYAYFTAAEPARLDMNGELQFAGFTAIFWWFASRYNARPSSVSVALPKK